MVLIEDYLGEVHTSS